jgi:hypothetical protein
MRLTGLCAGRVANDGNLKMCFPQSGTKIYDLPYLSNLIPQLRDQILNFNAKKLLQDRVAELVEE